jgi:hypothetical protein
VDCGSWPVEFAEKTWGAEFQLKTTAGEIRQVGQNRNTGLPLFNIHFSETRNTYTKLDLDYVLKYSMEVPLKYHQLKADHIMYLTKQASKPSKRQAVIDINEEPEATQDKMPSTVSENQTKKKRGGSEPVIIGRKKKLDAKQSEKKVGMPNDPETFGAQQNINFVLV